MRNHITFTALAAAIGLAGANSANADPITYEFALQHSISQPNGSFGYDLDAHSGTLIVGAPSSNAAEINAGAAFLVDIETGAITRTIISGTPSSGDEFGIGVAIASNRYVVGEIDDTIRGLNKGSAFLFDRASGTLIDTLLGTVNQERPGFGSVIDMDDQRILMGTPRANSPDGDRDVGKVETFNTQTTIREGSLSAPTRQPNQRFGTAVELEGDRAYVSAPISLFGPNGEDTTGNIFVYDMQTESRIMQFTNPNGGFSDYFGRSIAVDGDFMLVGASDYQGNGFIEDGRAYLFNTVTGELLRTFENPNSSPRDEFGYDVSIFGNLGLITAPGDNGPGGITRAGAGYLFDLITGELLNTFYDPTPGPTSFFGWSGLLTDGAAIFGAPFRGGGEVHIYSIEQVVEEAVPSPGALWLFALGLIGLLARKRVHLIALFATLSFASQANAALIAHYQLDGNGIDVVNGQSGTVFGATATIDRFGNAGAAMEFDGVDDTIIVTATPLLRSDHYSVSFFAKTTGIVEGYVWDGQYSDTPSTGSGYGVYISGDTPSEPVIGGPSVSQSTQPSGNIGAKSSVSMNDGTWHHVAATYDGVISKVFVDGVLTGTAFPVAGPIRWFTPPVAHSFYIGRLSPALITGLPGRFYEGALDDIKIFDNALSDAQIAGLAEVPAPGAAWLALIGLAGIAVWRRTSTAVIE